METQVEPEVKESNGKEKTSVFYLVVKDRGETERLTGKRRHATKEIAVAEARRLVEKDGGRFLIFTLSAVRQGKKKIVVETP